MNDRDQIEMQLADAKRARGFALLHNKRHDDSEIARLEKLLEVQADIETARTEQARADSAKNREAEITAIRIELADLSAASTKALAEAEANLRAAVSAMRLHHTHEAAKRKAQATLSNLTGTKEPILNEMELHRQGSLKWMTLIKQITNHPGEYGSLKYPGMTLPKDKSWT
jgi:hypothetical protein